MPVQPSEIRWASYQACEGPFFIGRVKYAPPQSPDFLDKCLQVLAATEGGRYDAINMYDTCILTVGIIQVCEAVFEFSKMLGACTGAGLGTIRRILSQMPVPADFRQNAQGQWRFFFLDGRGEVDSKDKMRTMFLGGSSGLKGQWTDEQKQHAREVAAAMASLWEDQPMQDGQREYVKPHLMTYVRPATKAALFSDPDEDGYKGALKAAMISYSANLPAVADKFFMLARASADWASIGERDRFVRAMQHVVFDPKIGIWPGRYRAIRPALESLFGVTVPALEDLQGAIPAPDAESAALSSPSGIQSFLIGHGYDLGPAGADGVFGPKTKLAVATFQKFVGLTPDGMVGPKTTAAMLAVLQKDKSLPGS